MFCQGQVSTNVTFLPYFQCWGQLVKNRQEKITLAAVLTKNIRIYHECEGGIEKSGLRITVWHHMALQSENKK